jgi:Cu2+-exporting ATPase
MGADLGFFVRHRDDGTAAMNLAVDGITCSACIFDIEQALHKLPGLIEARVNYTNRRLRVAWNEGKFNPEEVVAELAKIGYRVHPFEASDLEADEARHAAWLLRCLAVAGFAAMNIMLLSVSIWSGNISDITPEARDLFHAISGLIALPAAAYAGQPFFRGALRALKARSLNMDVPISLGVLLALLMSIYETVHHAENAYFDSAIMLLFFLLIGRVAEHAMRRKTRSVAGNLAALAAPTACRIERNGEIAEVPVGAINPGEMVLVRPGSRISVDGVIMSGASQVDESLVTGETQWRSAGEGEMVYAGTMNMTGALHLRVAKACEGTLLDEIQRLVEAAVTAKAGYVRLADRVARLYAPVVHLTALLTAIAWLGAGASLHQAIITAIAVLIITCPCALALAVPAVQVVAASHLFRSGVLLNAGDGIERLATIDTVVFDKTGTLTLPEPAIANAADIPAATLAMAGRLALSSHHPLARTLARQAFKEGVVAGAVETPGMGVSAMIEGVEARLGSPQFCDLVVEAQAALKTDSLASIVAFRHADVTALFKLRQGLRPDAVETIAALKRLGFFVAVLSGDRAEAVEPIAAALQIDEWHGGLKPAEKLAMLKRWKDEGRKLLMVGDGLNDAPALAAAHVSVSPITAADVTQNAADAVFLGERLAPVLSAIETAQKARRLMRQNLALAAIYNLVAVPLAMAGLVTPLIAALAMSLSSILVTVNALRAGPSRMVLVATPQAPQTREGSLNFGPAA